jgi:hypothetical protein
MSELDKVALGAWVDLELVAVGGYIESLTVVLTPDSEADLSAGLVGINTPLAQAIVGQIAGAVVSYRRGDIETVRIVAVTPNAHVPADEAAASRQAILQKAISKSDQANAISFALTVENKWGDYDPEGIAENWE